MEIDRLEHHVAHLRKLLDDDNLDLALVMAKRVRRDATLSVRAIAAAIDATAQEAQANE